VRDNLGTARRYLEAAFRDDIETCAQLVATTYTYTDRTKAAVADSADALLQAQQDDINAWSDKELVIQRMMEATDGTVVTQFTITNTHTGFYKGIAPTGVRVTTAACNLLTFDHEGRIATEEAYYDDLQTMLKLGAVQWTRPTEGNA
jgi:steroid delta-isomerase-like uncharacterized protein